MLMQWEALEHQAMQEQWSYAQFLLALCETEVERRWSQRLKRAINEAQLPTDRVHPSLARLMLRIDCSSKYTDAVIPVARFSGSTVPQIASPAD